MSYHIINDFEPDWDRVHCFLDAIAELEAKREWVGLTDDEITDLFMGNNNIDDLVVYEVLVKIIEAKLKEKNT